MTGTGERASQPGDSGLVLVLNSGSSSVKFALVDPGSGQRVTDGLVAGLVTSLERLDALVFTGGSCAGRADR